MEKTIEELKILIRELVLEVGDLRERVTSLENQLNKLSTSHEQVTVEECNQKELLELQGEGYENLGKLYAEGYHICPAAFGKPLSGDCLFCIAFIEKE
ncbi:MAG TPA: DUF972 family protein [Syntrophomonadaceae bacterium]|nr:DUF972 family protein [Syntrophomonadaceae bacterium]